MEAVLEQKRSKLSQEEILKGIEWGEMNARFEGVDLTQDPLWRDTIKPQLLAGAIDFSDVHGIIASHYAQLHQAQQRYA